MAQPSLEPFDRKSQAFMGWFNSTYVDYYHSNCIGTTPPDDLIVDLVDFRSRNAGRGVVAKESRILEGRCIFEVPRCAILSVENSHFRTSHQEYLNMLDNDPWQSLILVMMYELGLGRASRWKDYLAILPEEFDTLMYWSAEELAELQGCAVLDKIGKEAADEMFVETFLPIVQKNPALFGMVDDEHLQNRVVKLGHRMASIIMAYAFDLDWPSRRPQETDEEGYATEEEDEDLPKGLVPLADMLNANGQEANNARLEYKNNSLVMAAIKDIAQGEEIFNDYGLLPNSDLLRRYGYVTQEYSKYDVVEVSRSLIVDIAKEQPDHDSDEEYDSYDICRISAVEGPLDIFPVELIRLLEDSPPRRARKRTRPGNELPPRFHSIMKKVLRKRLADYPHSLEADYALLSALDAEKSQSRKARRLKMAVMVRIGEKEILTDALEVLETNDRAQIGIKKREMRSAGDVDGDSVMTSPKKHKSSE